MERKKKTDKKTRKYVPIKERMEKKERKNKEGNKNELKKKKERETH